MDSTTLLDTLLAAQNNKEVRINDQFDAVIPGAFGLGRRASTASGLVWGFYGVPRYYINGTAVPKANATVTLTASSTRYVNADRALAVTEVASAFAPDKLALFKAVTSGSAVTSYEDHRDPHHLNRFLYGRFVLAMADANKTLTYEQAMCESMELTGTNTALRDVIVPLVPRSWIVFANTATNGVRVIGASGTGITIAVGKRAIVECDGTNVVRITADV